MDVSITKAATDSRGGGPVVVLANWFQFGPSERTMRPCVESRMFLWCRRGKGMLWINDEPRAFEADDWILLPWQHAIIYEPDAQFPFFVGGIHLVPWHADRVPVVFSVAHQESDPLAKQPERSDAHWPGLEKPVHGSFSGETDPLALLASYVVERYLQTAPERNCMASLAELLIGEIALANRATPPGKSLRPATLRRMQDYARSHLHRPISVSDLARAGGCSPAGVHRQFQSFEATSPGRWLAQLRVQRSVFLLRTTTLAVREVAAQVGFDDPFHFSRFFKRQMGESPRGFRSDHNFP
ncbi:MAG: helix-turn-helix transcriptional regulator [Terrimicrobiaceae bacterium]